MGRCHVLHTGCGSSACTSLRPHHMLRVLAAWPGVCVVGGGFVVFDLGCAGPVQLACVNPVHACHFASVKPCCGTVLEGPSDDSGVCTEDCWKTQEELSAEGACTGALLSALNNSAVLLKQCGTGREPQATRTGAMQTKRTAMEMLLPFWVCVQTVLHGRSACLHQLHCYL